MDIYQHDESFRKEGFKIIAGIDEAGRGPLAGPVVAAAVILPQHFKLNGLRDSKKVPEKERQGLFFDILASSSAIGLGIVENDVIDRFNILQATKMAMEEAINDLAVSPDMLIIDAVTLPSVSIKQLSPFRAESKSASVAAASIIAKYVRDSIMLQYHEMYPVYNFRKHKGYGTGEHTELIRLHGPCPIHRKTFKKVCSVEMPFQKL